jgi:phospholipid/cholesterol/gamma-HCH transport system substrate-binding protein
VSRTSVPYNLVSAFQQFAKFGNAVDKQQLTESLTTLARSVSSISPAMARKAVQGLASMATTLAAKQQQVSEILTSANRITNTLNSNSTALTQLLLDGDAFLQLVQQRHDLIVELLRDTAKLGAQLDALVRTNGAHLSGLIANLDSVSALLEREKAQLQQAVVVLGQFSVNIANVTGAGPWLDLLLPNSAIPDNMIKACGAHPDASKRPCGD